MSDKGAPREISPDYDHDPARFRMARSVLRQHGLVPDIHASVAERFVFERLLPVLDIGCGEGELAKHLPEDSWVGVDNSAEMLRRAPQPKLRAAATALPFPDDSIASVALLYVLYHLARPERALAEAHRVLRRRGLVAVATPSRYDSPELAHYLPSLPLTFYAERAAELVAAFFGDVEIETWDGPFLELPTKAAVCDYLIGKGVEQTTAHAGADEVKIPLLVTKRGALVFARKR